MDTDKLNRLADHDLLILLHTKMDNLIATDTDHEKRLRKLESDGQVHRGALAILIFLTGLIEPALIFFKGKN